MQQKLLRILQARQECDAAVNDARARQEDVPAALMNQTHNLIQTIAFGKPSSYFELAKEQKDLQHFVHGYIQKIGTHYHLDIPVQRLPTVRYFSKPTSTLAHYDPAQNIIEINREVLMHADVGTYIGEEIGHFLRSHFTNTIPERTFTQRVAALFSRSPQLEESTKTVNVDEFFGFTGRKLLHGASNEMDREKLFYGREIEYDQSTDVRKLRNIRTSIHSRVLPNVAIQAQKGQRKDILEHARGYKHAQQLDITKVHDWKKFFQMSEGEVHKRFFRADQDYTGLQESGSFQHS